MKPYYHDDASGITIYHGDCREVLPEVLSEHTAVVIADPPFSVPVKYEDAKGVYPRSWGDLVVMEPFFREVFSAVRAATGQLSQVYFCCDGNSYPVFYKVGLSFWPQSKLLVWYKPTGRRGRGWHSSHELIIHFRTPITPYPERGIQQDVIGIMPVRTLNRQHPTEKPGELCDWLLDNASPEHRLVVDPFMGSGTTLIAAKHLERRAIGIEIEERYCEIAARRLDQCVLDLGVHRKAEQVVKAAVERARRIRRNGYTPEPDRRNRT